MAREGFGMPDSPFDSMSRFADVVAKQRLEYIARIDKAVAELKALAWDLIEMEFPFSTPDESVHREQYRTIRKRVNDIADGCYGIGPSGLPAPFTYGPVVAGPELAAELPELPVEVMSWRICVHCGGTGVKCCEFGANR